MADPAPGTVRTLLIVDDHAGFRTFARAVLEADDYVILGEAHDAASAVQAARALNPDVVLLDVALPDLDGFAVCEQILGAGGSDAQGARRPPVVVLTSTRDVSAFRRRLTQSRAVGFIAKRDLTGPALARAAAGERPG